VNRRRFLHALALGAAPAVLSTGLGTAVVRAEEDPRGLETEALSGPGLGVQHIVWSGPTVPADGIDVAFTFDDGPDPELTPRLLDLLKQRDIRATFLVIGERASERPDLLRRAIDDGHEIGNHTWSHHTLAQLSKAEIERELTRTAEVISQPVRWFRPPNGVITGAGAQVAAAHHYDILMWSCSGSSHALATPPQVAAHIEHHLEHGSVIDLHDGLGRAGFSRWRATVDAMRRRRAMELAALPEILARAKERGVRFVTMSELDA